MGLRKQIKEKYGIIPALARYEVLDKIKEMELRDRALVCFLYLTGCRIEEACKFIKETNPRRILIKKDNKGNRVEVPMPIDRKMVGTPITKKQIEIENDVMIIRNVRILKRKKMMIRDIPVIIWDKEMPFIDTVKEYIDSLKDDDFLFDMTRQRGHQILAEANLFPHWLRHIRATHLVRDYGFNTEHLRQFTGWTDSKPAAQYVHLNVDDLLAKMNEKAKR